MSMDGYTHHIEVKLKDNISTHLYDYISFVSIQFIFSFNNNIHLRLYDIFSFIQLLHRRPTLTKMIDIVIEEKISRRDLRYNTSSYTRHQMQKYTFPSIAIKQPISHRNNHTFELLFWMNYMT